MESIVPFVTLSDLPVEIVAVWSIVVFGNILPLGLIVWMFWYATRHEISSCDSPPPILSRRAKSLRQAA